jgi:hypothetical protein
MVHTTKRIVWINKCSGMWKLGSQEHLQMKHGIGSVHDNPRFRFRFLRTQEDRDKVGCLMVCRLQKNCSRISTSQVNNWNQTSRLQKTCSRISTSQLNNWNQTSRLQKKRSRISTSQLNNWNHTSRLQKKHSRISTSQLNNWNQTSRLQKKRSRISTSQLNNWNQASFWSLQSSLSNWSKLAWPSATLKHMIYPTYIHGLGASPVHVY